MIKVELKIGDTAITLTMDAIDAVELMKQLEIKQFGKSLIIALANVGSSFLKFTKNKEV